MKLKTVCIVGTGPAALMAGTVLLENGYKVLFFDQKKAPARKFLVAGHGGFNLSNSEELELFVSHYDKLTVKNAVRSFTNNDFRNFLLKINIETYIGSSGKIFPVKGIKPIQVLTNWKNYLYHLGAEFFQDHKIIDFQSSKLTFDSNSDVISVSCEAIILALGGASWPVTGSDGNWIDLAQKKGIECVAFGPSNSGFVLKNLFTDLSGQKIKNCKLFSSTNQKMGDVVLTDYGIEGAPIYALNRAYRSGEKIFIDFKPDLEETELVKKLEKAKNSTEGLKAIKLSKAAISILQKLIPKEDYVNREKLAKSIKKLELEIENLRPINEVISTIGGIAIDSLDENFELKCMPEVYCIGEMVDWDAPTGGYLIQGCVSMGHLVGNKISHHS
jgi:uncharacterized flavoprotein (TIGR03862 family)